MGTPNEQIAIENAGNACNRSKKYAGSTETTAKLFVYVMLNNSHIVDEGLTALLKDKLNDVEYTDGIKVNGDCADNDCIFSSSL